MVVWLPPLLAVVVPLPFGLVPFPFGAVLLSVDEWVVVPGGFLDDLVVAPEDVKDARKGDYMYGLHLNVIDSLPKVLYTSLPVIHQPLILVVNEIIDFMNVQS